MEQTTMLISIIILFVLITMLYNLYVSVVKSKNTVLEALSGVDVQLRKRYDLIPNILTIAKKFMEHEHDLFEKITALRSQAIDAKLGSKEKFQAENALDAQLKALMVNVENYPTLKSDSMMEQAMNTYNEVEENIAASRRFYNSALTQLKNIIEIFPGSLFASFAGEVASFSYYEAEKASKEPVNAQNYL